ncbi:MAG: hypothetical protein II822_11155 [Prevotella sp.]|nr:hypothetical protein [Prevotella sp.]
MRKPIIIDTCVLSKVFISKVEGHDNFKPVLEAMLKGKCTMLFGGTKYRDEVTKVKKVWALINQMKKGIVTRLDDQAVDSEQARIEQLITHPGFNDPHLPAMAIVGQCHLICTDDTECIPHIKNRCLYPTHFSTPRFYLRAEHKEKLYEKK